MGARGSNFRFPGACDRPLCNEAPSPPPPPRFAPPPELFAGRAAQSWPKWGKIGMILVTSGPALIQLWQSLANVEPTLVDSRPGQFWLIPRQDWPNSTEFGPTLLELGL